MKNVLIVSDNQDLVSFFKIIENTLKPEVASFDYYYSKINKNPHSLQEIGMGEIDMRNNSDVNHIIDNYDLVISLHCKQIFPSKLVKSVRCINVHPGLNPFNRGWYPQVFSIINKKPIGCTVHLMDEEIDHGSIIYQKEVSINSWDTSLDVYNKVASVEKEILKKYLYELITEDYVCKELNDAGNYNGIQDFKELTELDISAIGSLSKHIDLLRALTHGEFKNAYFIDDKGNKVFVKLSLEKSCS